MTFVLEAATILHITVWGISPHTAVAEHLDELYEKLQLLQCKTLTFKKENIMGESSYGVLLESYLRIFKLVKWRSTHAAPLQMIRSLALVRACACALQREPEAE